MKALLLLALSVTSAWGALTSNFNQYITSSVVEVGGETFRYSYRISPSSLASGNLEDLDIFFDGSVVIDFVRVPVVYPVTIEDTSISWTLASGINNNATRTFVFETTSAPVVGRATVKVGGSVFEDNVWVPKGIPEPEASILFCFSGCLLMLKRKR